MPWAASSASAAVETSGDTIANSWASGHFLAPSLVCQILCYPWATKPSCTAPTQVPEKNLENISSSQCHFLDAFPRPAFHGFLLQEGPRPNPFSGTGSPPVSAVFLPVYRHFLPVLLAFSGFSLPAGFSLAVNPTWSALTGWLCTSWNAPPYGCVASSCCCILLFGDTSDQNLHHDANHSD